MTNVVVHLSGRPSHCSQLAQGARRALDELPDTVLKDFGLARSDIPFIAGKLVCKYKDPARRYRPVRLERSVAERNAPQVARRCLSSRDYGGGRCFGDLRAFIRRPYLERRCGAKRERSPLA